MYLNKQDQEYLMYAKNIVVSKIRHFELKFLYNKLKRRVLQEEVTRGGW